MEHRGAVRYLEEALPGGTRLSSDWAAQTGEDDVVTVSGPCPKCGGRAFGPPPPELPGLEDLLQVRKLPGGSMLMAW